MLVMRRLPPVARPAFLIFTGDAIRLRRNSTKALCWASEQIRTKLFEWREASDNPWRGCFLDSWMGEVGYRFTRPFESVFASAQLAIFDVEGNRGYSKSWSADLRCFAIESELQLTNGHVQLLKSVSETPTFIREQSARFCLHWILLFWSRLLRRGSMPNFWVSLRELAE